MTGESAAEFKKKILLITNTRSNRLICHSYLVKVSILGFSNMYVSKYPTTRQPSSKAHAFECMYTDFTHAFTPSLSDSKKIS